jgi:hypothetical protein
MQGVAILAHVCQEVHVYGMGGSTALAMWYSIIIIIIIIIIIFKCAC